MGSFLDKSIQVHFEVPLPLLTDWRAYLSSLLRSALPEHDADHYTVYRLYQYRAGARAQGAEPPRAEALRQPHRRTSPALAARAAACEPRVLREPGTGRRVMWRKSSGMAASPRWT